MTVSLFILTAFLLALSAFKVKQIYIYKHCTERREKKRVREREGGTKGYKNVRKYSLNNTYQV